MSDAVVFAYSSVGHECLSVLLRRGVNIKLVYTHEDDPNEEHWFDSVYELAKSRNIPVRTDSPEESVVREAKPDVIFSFYYRSMIDMKILDVAPLGAFNMHGSLLPKYRGRACVNWAVLNGETKAGVTLHHMTARADAGNIVGQEAVDIGPDETAHDIFTKIIPAAGRLLERCLDDILSGNAEGTPQDESQATKFGRRTPADGLIDWSKSAREIHNLVRAVAKPFPGAFTYHDGHKIMVWKTRIVDTPPTFGHLPLAEAAGAENYTPPEKGERTTHWRGGQTNNNPSVSSRHLPLAGAAKAENYTPPEKGERATQWRGGQTNNNPSVSSRHLPLAEAAGAENYTPPEKGERASSLARGSDFTQSPALLVKTHDGTLEILEWEIV